MPRSSNANLSAETIAELESQFYQFLNSLTPEERKDFFSEFLTTEEKMMMYKRLALYWSLLEGYPLARIQEMIGVTHDTTRVYNKRKNTLSDHFKSLVKRISTSQVLTQPHKKEEPEMQTVVEPEAAPVVEELSQPEEPIIKEEVTVMEEVFAQKEPEEEVTSTAPVMEEKMNDITEPEIEREKKDEEEMHETDMDMQPTQTDEPMHHEHIQQEEIHSESTESMTPPQPQESEQMQNQNVEQSNENNEEEGTQKKKSGLAKFFGF
jgi:hypothetical protein